ncbi:Crp/Fnr family transcriptional regulator [Solibacillus silvestris]|uniref:Crp/Fnr family transcriptional regulator n=1 Tax=Solibacillus silvestris TaxID=76853 RepID=UPI003F7DB293
MDLEKFSNVYTYTFPSELIAEIQWKTYEPNDAILTAGDEIDGLYFLVEGKYYVSSLEITGKELLLRYSKVPAILGDIEVLEQCTIQSNCIAAERCEFIFVPLITYKNCLQNDALFAQLLLKELAYKLKTCTVSSRVNALSPVSVRLAAYYCTIASGNANSEYIISNKLDEVAALIGTTKRHLNRIMRQWQEEGLIYRQGDNVQFLDWDAIQSYSEGVRFE